MTKINPNKSARKTAPAAMDGAEDWQDLCRKLKVNPEEVRLVFARYDAYRQFNAGGNSDLISIDQWFRFYHMEKASEGSQTGPEPSGCSVDSGAVNDACIKRPDSFIQVLRAYLAAEAVDSL
jgi:hypothetical protein